MAGATAWAPASHLQVLTSGFLCQRPGSSGAGRPPRSPRSQPGTRRCLMRLMASVRCPLGAGWKERKGAPAQRTDTSLVQGTPPPVTRPCGRRKEGEPQAPSALHPGEPARGSRPTAHLQGPKSRMHSHLSRTHPSALRPVPGTLGAAQRSREALALAGAGSQVIWLLGGGALVQTQAPGMTITPPVLGYRGPLPGNWDPDLAGNLWGRSKRAPRALGHFRRGRGQDWGSPRAWSPG